MEEHFFSCPYCFESISMLIDKSIPVQEYIEDCEICCNPIEVKLRVSDNQLVEFEVQNIGQ